MLNAYKAENLINHLRVQHMSILETSFNAQIASNHSSDVYDDGHLRVEHDNYYVACDGTPIKLPRTEFLIFSRLVRTPDRIVTSEALWASVWGPEKPLNSESLHVYIYRLRIKLGSFGLQIDTMVNVGYRLITASAR
jgi:two-component system KDP operon response regulator KdpE